MKILVKLIMLIYASIFYFSCSDSLVRTDVKESAYANEYLEIVIKSGGSRTSYYSSSDINSYKLTVKFNDSSVDDISAEFNKNDNYSFNIFKNCRVTLEIEGFNSSGKKIAFGTKDVDFSVGNDVVVLVAIDMLQSSSTITVGVIINERNTTNLNFTINNVVYDKTCLVTIISETEGEQTVVGSFGSGPFASGRTVILSPYEIGKYEVTQEFYEAVMGENPSCCKDSFSGEDSNKKPVDYANWYQVIAFCNKLSAIMGLEPVYTVSGITNWETISFSSVPSGYDDSWQSASIDLTKNGYRLPTEAEWEYAARGGNTQAEDWNYNYAGSNNYSEVAWVRENSFNNSHEVGLKVANILGLYDMSGNVYEWCSDFYSNLTSTTQVLKNPIIISGTYRVQRSGAWKDPASDSSLEMRRTDSCGGGDSAHWHDWGFRLCRNLSTLTSNDVTYIE